MINSKRNEQFKWLCFAMLHGFLLGRAVWILNDMMGGI